MAGTTLARNEVWRSEIDIWRDTVAKSPNKPRPWLNLGAAYYEGGRPEEAAACFQRVIQLVPNSVHGYRNLSTAQNKLGLHRQALSTAQAGLDLAPNYSELLPSNLSGSQPILPRPTGRKSVPGVSLVL
jgi:tetratricopeptide (TPR) repeat protein